MFVNGIPFLVTFLRRIKMITYEHVTSRTADRLANSIKNVVLMYARGGFIVDLKLMDMEFKKVKEKLGIVKVNTTAARAHVSEIERQIRLVK